jgi:hypothetical protein
MFFPPGIAAEESVAYLKDTCKYLTQFGNAVMTPSESNELTRALDSIFLHFRRDLPKLVGGMDVAHCPLEKCSDPDVRGFSAFRSSADRCPSNQHQFHLVRILFGFSLHKSRVYLFGLMYQGCAICQHLQVVTAKILLHFDKAPPVDPGPTRVLWCTPLAKYLKKDGGQKNRWVCFSGALLSMIECLIAFSTPRSPGVFQGDISSSGFEWSCLHTCNLCAF